MESYVPVVCQPDSLKVKCFKLLDAYKQWPKDGEMPITLRDEYGNWLLQCMEEVEKNNIEMRSAANRALGLLLQLPGRQHYLEIEMLLSLIGNCDLPLMESLSVRIIIWYPTKWQYRRDDPCDYRCLPCFSQDDRRDNNLMDHCKEITQDMFLDTQYLIKCFNKYKCFVCDNYLFEIYHYEPYLRFIGHH